MLEGLIETKAALEKRGIRMVVRRESPEIGVGHIARDASLVVTDCGYAKIQRQWRAIAAEILGCPLVQVESDVVVPTEVVSRKREYSAATIRPKIHRELKKYLIPVKKNRVKKGSMGLRLPFFDIDDIDRAMRILKVDSSVAPVSNFKGGTDEAKKRLRSFIKLKLKHYLEWKNDPLVDGLSNMSPYLHFGQISPLYIALEVRKRRGKGRDAYLEELIVRREIAINFCLHERHHDSFAGLPEWCRATLMKHRRNKRPYTYSVKQLEKGLTYDSYWNAAQQEMVIAGKMHGYMRTYWGKKIIEWVKNPKKAYDIMVYLNDKYELDGRDPNGYAGIAWCFGNHDRPWAQRKIFGTVRYMNDKGLRRKFDAEAYVRKIERLRK